MSKIFCLSVTYNDDKRYERGFDKIEDIPPFIKEAFLKYGIASIVFANDMSEVDNTDFEGLFENILTENDKDTLDLYEEHIQVWNDLTSAPESIDQFIIIFNERYSKELNGEPKLEFHTITNNLNG